MGDGVVPGIKEKCLDVHPTMFRTPMCLADSKIRRS